MHDVLEANQDGIKKFVEWWIQTYSSKEGRKVLQLKDIKEMFAMVPRGEEKTLKEVLGLVEAGIVLSFANAKFLVIDEMTHANQLMTMKVDELYEFICRIADLAKLTGVGGWTTPPNEEAEAHSDMEDVIPEGNEDNSASVMKTTAIQEPMGQQMLIQDKVFNVIDLLLRLCKDPGLNLRAVKPNRQGLADSESDYDSD